MTEVMVAALAFVLGVEIDVAADEPLAPALARARPGDVVRLGPGLHTATLGRPVGIRVEGAGAGVTVVAAPEGEDGVVATGQLELAGLTLRTGPERCALKVLEDGDARLDHVTLAGGGCGAFVDGRLRGRDVAFEGGYGLLVSGRGDAAVDAGSARGRYAGVGVLTGTVALRRFAVTGPAYEAGITVAGGSATLEAVVIRSPGPAGIAISSGGRVAGVDVTVAGAREEHGMLGDCVTVIRGELRLEGATLVRCAGAAVEASGGTIRLEGVDASGGAAGCLILVNGADAELSANLCAGRGPGLVVTSRSRARLTANRWWTDPLLWAECGAGVQVEVGRGEKLKPPCAQQP
jgi:hypothetical protein